MTQELQAWTDDDHAVLVDLGYLGPAHRRSSAMTAAALVLLHTKHDPNHLINRLLGRALCTRPRAVARCSGVDRHG